MSILHMNNIDLAGKRVLIREDFNVPMNKTGISNDARIKAALPTIQLAIEKGASVILVSHLGRPIEGQTNPALSLKPVAERLQTLLDRPVRFVDDWLEGITIAPGEVVLCENVRFNMGEKANDETLSKKIAALCDIFVMDAFATAHRAQASTHGIACFAPIACAGPLLIQELDALSCATQNSKPPVLAIVGGAKISTKLNVLKLLCQQVDILIPGGGIANTFLASCGYPVGNSLFEKALLEDAETIQAIANDHQCTIAIPSDVVVAEALHEDAAAQTKPVNAVEAKDMILDIGPETSQAYVKLIKQANTIIWNGPVGVFEITSFSQGTQAIAKAIAEHSAFSIAGGGDTIAALEQFNVAEKMSYISTGGGAFLEFLEGKTLPAIEVLEQRAHEVS